MATIWCFAPGRHREPRSRCEAHVSTQQKAPVGEAWLPGAYVHPRRARRLESPSPEGPQAALGLIGRLHSRDEFERLRRHGTRVRSGVLWCVMLNDPDLDGPRMAFAIGRPAGNAVERNRARRRLREAFRRVSLPNGLYLVGLTGSARSVSFSGASTAAEAVARRASL